MKSKIIIAIIVTISILSITSILPFNQELVDKTTFIDPKPIQSVPSGDEPGDVLDQNQSLQNSSRRIGWNQYMSSDNLTGFQSFIQKKTVLTRIELFMWKSQLASQPCVVAIRDNLTGEDLTSVGVSPTEIEDYSWVEFDFMDIEVIPGQTYYIVTYTTATVEGNTYWWGRVNQDIYPNGTAYYRYKPNNTIYELNSDYTFKTYSRESNSPPETPDQPDGPTNGIVGVDYSFTTNEVSDPDDHEVLYLFDWGDGETSGWITLPSARHSWDTEGTYWIKIKAKDIYDAESEWSNPSIISIVEQTPEEPVSKGWIFGSVYDAEGEPIEAVSICVQISDIKKECAATNEGGQYQIHVQTGDYSVEVNKEGYVMQTKPVNVLEDQAFNLDFTLVETEDVQIPDENIIAIENAISQGNVGGTVTFAEEAEKIYYTTSLYITEVDLVVTEITKDKISLIVSADETVTGNTIIIQMDEEIFSSDDFEITLDGESIPEADNITDILYAHDDGPFAESYILEDPNGGKLIFLSFSHYSEHTITITSVIEAIVGPTAILIYIIICIVGASSFIYPFVIIPIRIKKGNKW